MGDRQRRRTRSRTRNEGVTEIVEMPEPRPRAHDRQRLARGRRHGARVRQAVRLAMADPDQPVEDNIETLIAREHELRSHAEGRGLSEEEQAEQRALEVRLDQLWDLLRRRRALRAAGEDPEEARVPPRGRRRELRAVAHAAAGTRSRSRTASSGAATSWPPAQSAQSTRRRGVRTSGEAEDAAEADERGADRHARVERADRGRLGRRGDARGLLRWQAGHVGARERALLRDRAPRSAPPARARRRRSGRSAGPENWAAITAPMRGDAEQPRGARDRVVDARGDPGVLLVGVGEHRRGQRRDGRRQADREQRAAPAAARSRSRRRRRRAASAAARPRPPAARRP